MVQSSFTPKDYHQNYSLPQYSKCNHTCRPLFCRTVCPLYTKYYCQYNEASSHVSDCQISDTLSKIGFLPQNLWTIIAIPARLVDAVVGTASQDLTTKRKYQQTGG